MNESDFNKVFSARLRHYLSINNMSQLDLSKRLGVGTTSVSNWCTGLKSPRMDKVDAMCRIFHCRRSDLMEEPAAGTSNPMTRTLSPDEAGLLDDYQKLNDLGKKKAREDLADLTEIPKYVNDYPDTMAAHFDGEEMTDQQKAAIAKLRDIVKQQEK